MSAMPDHDAFRRALADHEQPDPAIVIPAILAAADMRPSGDGRRMARAIADGWSKGVHDVGTLTSIAVRANDIKR